MRRRRGRFKKRFKARRRGRAGRRRKLVGRVGFRL